MNKNSEKTPACKDGGENANAQLTDLVGAFDRLGFRVLKMETNGLDYDLVIRRMPTDNED